MPNRGRRNRHASPFYSFAITWVILAWIFPVFKLWGLLVTLGICSFIAYCFGLGAARKDKKQAAKSAPKKETVKSAPVSEPVKKSYGPEIDPILADGNRALSEMGRLYMSIKDPEVRQKINEIMRITDKIVQDAIQDPSDIPQIKKFMNYYLPTTIKLLNTYDRMSAQGIAGENLDKSMRSINEMLDAAIIAYKKRLDSLFENQALDIETDIQVMNQMLAREGLTDNKDFEIKTSVKGEAQ